MPVYCQCGLIWPWCVCVCDHADTERGFRLVDSS